MSETAIIGADETAPNLTAPLAYIGLVPRLRRCLRVSLFDVAF